MPKPPIELDDIPNDDDGVQTHEDIPEIPEGAEIPDSSGSLTPDVEAPEPVDYEEEA